MELQSAIDKIKAKRPELSVSSLKSYTSTISALFYHFHPRNVKFNPNFFADNPDEILKFMADLSLNSAKTRLSALVVLLEGLDTEKSKESAEKYRRVMSKHSDEVRMIEEQNKMTDAEKENWLSMDELEKKRQELEKTVKPLWVKARLTDEERRQLQRLIILSVYLYIPPRRAEYSTMKLRNYNKETDNYFDVKERKLVFNQYKTAKTYGRWEIPLIEGRPKELFNLLNRWKKLMLSYDYLFENAKHKNLTPTAIKRELDKVFEPKSLGPRLFRHIFVNDLYSKSLPSVQDLKKISGDMGQSLNQQMLYRRIPDDEESEDDKENGASSSTSPPAKPKRATKKQ